MGFFGDGRAGAVVLNTGNTRSAMGLFSKLFGKPEPQPEAVVVPDEATNREVIAIAIRAVVEKQGGNCATLTLEDDTEKWVQMMDCTINCHYPHEEDPESRFPGFFGLPLVAGFEGYDPELFMTVSLTEMNELEIVQWIERYYAEVLSVDLGKAKLKLRMEEI